MPAEPRSAALLYSMSSSVSSHARQGDNAMLTCVRWYDFRCARIILGGIELMHMISKGQMNNGGALERSVAEQFYGLAT